MEQVTSKDGTKIAFDKVGQGAPLVLVGGALSTRDGGAPLVEQLKEHFTLYSFDRRGRGDSGDTQPYAVAREIEDLEAVIDAAGGSAYVLGVSSGAALALQTANTVPNKIKKLALYEPPFIVDDTHAPMSADYSARLAAFLKAGQRGDALELFLREAVEVPAEMIAGMRNAPMWAGMEQVAPTLAYDQKVMGDTMSGKPFAAGRWGSATMPTLVIAGGASAAWMKNGAQAAVKVLPAATYRELEGQTHSYAPEVLAPVLKDFFA